MPATRNVVLNLADHQRESGIVTRGELDLAKRWWREIVPGDDRAGQSDGWLDGWLGTRLPFSFRYGGQDSSEIMKRETLQECSGVSGDGALAREFKWQDADTGLAVTWHVKRFEAYPAVEWVLEFENQGDRDTPVIENVQALDLWLDQPTEGQPYIIHGAQGGRSKPDDLMPFSWQVPFPGSPPKERAQLGGDVLSSNVHLPFFNVETPDKRGVMVGIGWSGTWSADFRADGSELSVSAGLEETYLVLHPGERIRTPRILLLFWQGERLHGHNMLRQLLFRHYVPPLRGEAREPLVTYNLAFAHHGQGIYFLDQATEEGVWPVVQPAIDVGTELFMIDAGWFEGEPWHATMGNWHISRSKYPRGFRPISEALAAGGVEVGVWFAPEIVSDGVPPPDGHVEWVSRGGRERLNRLRLEIPEARDWFVRQVDAIVENEGMTCYRTDIDPGRYVDPPGARKGITESHHIEGLYALWDALVDRHPGLIMEGCCGGGRRIDLETISRFHWIQKSDRWFDSESDQCSLYGANLYLPGGYLIIYTEAMDDYGAWSSFAGVLSIAWHLQDEDFPMSLAKLQIQRYRRMRPLLSGDFYPLTPCSLDAQWIGYQFHRVDLDAGFALLFRRSSLRHAASPPASTFTVRLRGLDPDQQYRVQRECAGTEQVLGGADLNNRIDIVIQESPGTEMIIYERAQEREADLA